MGEIIKLDIPAWKNRDAMLVALGSSGYRTWVEIVEKSGNSTSYVCFIKTKENNEQD